MRLAGSTSNGRRDQRLTRTGRGAARHVQEFVPAGRSAAVPFGDVGPRMVLYAVFGMNIGNLGRGQAPRRPMPEWVAAMSACLAGLDPGIRVIDSFGHTGNFLAASTCGAAPEVAGRFKDLLDTHWAVLPLVEVESAVRALAEAPEPEAEERVRWTPGLVMQVEAGPSGHVVASTKRAVLWRVSRSIIGARKRDALDANGRLDRNWRAGGWGAVARDVGRQLGGRWTARSLNAVEGLIEKARSSLGAPA